MKHAILSRQTIALLPLCFCMCNQDLFCTNNFFVFVFSLIQIKGSFVFKLLDNRFPMCVSEEPQRFVWAKWHILCLNKHLKKRADADADIILPVQSMRYA